MEEEYAKLDRAPISKIGSNREALLTEYKEQKTQYYELKIYIENFISKLNIEKCQLNNLQKQLKRIEIEIREHESLKKVFKSNILNEKGGQFLPNVYSKCFC